MLQRWPLTGREAERELADKALDDPGVHGVVFIGDEGVGKSRLAAETLALARARGLVTREALASAAAAQIPFGPLAHLLPLPSPVQADPFDVLRDARRILVEEADGRRLALAVDDAHLLDGASAALVHQLAATASAFVVITGRSAAVLPAPIVRLWKDGLVRRLEVAPLGDASVEEIISAALGGHVDGATGRDLVAAVRGNLLFLRELVEFGLASGRLADSDGVWRWPAPITPGGGLRELIEDRLRRLEPAERHLLEVLAAAEPLGAATLEQLAPPGTLGALDREGLLAVVREGNRTSVRFAHPLHAQVVHAATAPLQLRDIHGQLADATFATGSRRHDDRLRLTIWRTESGHPPPATDLVDGARQALAGADRRLAERLARAAVRVGGGFEAGLALGAALAAGGSRDEAEAVFASLREPVMSDDATMRLALARAANLCGERMRLRDADMVLERAQAAITDPAMRDELAAQRALMLISRGDTGQAVAVSSTIIDRPGARTTAVVRALRVAGFAHALTGQSDFALGCIDRGLHLLRAQAPGTLTGGAENQLIATRWEALWFTGRLDDAEALAWQQYRRGLAQRADGVRAMASLQLGLCVRERGRVRSAVEWLREAIALFRVVQPVMLPAALAALAQAHALGGEAAAAQTALDEAQADGTRPMPLDEVRTEVSRAWVTAARGDVAEAQSIALRAADVAGRVSIAALEAIALHTVVRLGDPQAVATRLQAVTEGADGPLLPTLARHAAAAAAGDGCGLDDVATAFERTGMLLHAAEAAAEAAAAYHRLGHRRLARGAAGRARTLLPRCEGARTPALAGLDRPPVMTARQRQIAALAADGMTSREIGDRLQLSARTVDNHLQHIYTKLDLRGRSALPTALVADAAGDDGQRGNGVGTTA